MENSGVGPGVKDDTGSDGRERETYKKEIDSIVVTIPISVREFKDGTVLFIHWVYEEVESTGHIDSP